MQDLAVHNYLDAPTVLPDRCFLQIHWYREPNFQSWLRTNQFRVMTVARHPLDGLISALRFIRHEPQTARWLEGNADIPDGLAGCAPCSKEFLDYATSFGAESFLSISYQWWHDPATIKVRYEQVVANPAGCLGALLRDLDDADPATILPWLERLSLEKMRALPNRHGWQGKPGLWKQFIVPADAIRIWSRHRMVFRTLGYSMPFYLLSRQAALKNWGNLA